MGARMDTERLDTFTQADAEKVAAESDARNLTYGSSERKDRPLLLDLFCGAGGAAMGYHRAGFDVVGVDIKDQPHYPFTFIRMDAIEFLRDWVALGSLFADFEVIHASPPCQHYSDLAGRNGNADEHPDLIGEVRDWLKRTGASYYVIENVEGAPLVKPHILCGSMFGLGVGGYRLRRHRLFETNLPFVAGLTCVCPMLSQRPIIDVSGGGPTHAPRMDGSGGRTYKGTVAEKRTAMGIGWMTGAEVVEAIPPAYTELLGRRLLTRLRKPLQVGATCA